MSELISFDGNPDQNLGTFATGFMEAEAEKLMKDVMGKNFIDQNAYPALESIHQRIISIIAHLFNAPENSDPTGTATTGSSEAIMLGLLAHKFNWRKHRQKQNKSIDKPNIVMGNNVHVCWQKFALYFDVSCRIINIQNNQLILTADKVAEAIDENTIAVGCVLGNTFTGQLDQIEQINELLIQLKKNKGWNIPIHVDAASGGFVIPFLHPELLWDFRLEQVASINVSNHKFGLVYPGMGSLVFQDKTLLPRELIFNVDYIGSTIQNYGLNFSKPSIMVLLQYYNFLRLGENGYKQVKNKLIQKTQYLEQKLLETGYFEFFSNTNYLPILVMGIKKNRGITKTVYEISQLLRARNWIVPAYDLPDREISVLRLVIKQNFSDTMLETLLQDIQEIMLIK